MRVTVNGETREFEHDATVAGAVASVTRAWTGPLTGVAVAVNGEIVIRGAWSEMPLHEADRLDVLTATQGG